MRGINVSELPREIRDKLELRADTDTTFYRALEEDYTDEFFETLNTRSQVDVQHSYIASVSGCHKIGARILTKTGIKNIEDIVFGDLVWDGQKWTACRLLKRGIQKCFEVRLNDNQKLFMTEDHRMLTGRGFIEVRNLRVNEDFFVL